MKKKLIKSFIFLSIFSVLFFLEAPVNASAVVKGWISGKVHTVPILTDNFTSYTTISIPSKEWNSTKMKAYMTIKVYNADGNYNSASETISGGSACDLPLDSGAKAGIRNAHKAVGTHKAKSYDTNYQWVSIPNSVWKK